MTTTVGVTTTSSPVRTMGDARPPRARHRSRNRRLLVGAAPAAASEQFGDLDVTFLSLKVNGAAPRSSPTERRGGVVRHVYVWGAINARAPDPGGQQVRFQYDYTGGWKRGQPQSWRSFRNRCAPYDGPKLVWLVAACKAPDGSYWALQRWQRRLPMRGVPTVQPEQAAYELHSRTGAGRCPCSRYRRTGRTAGAWQGLFGRLTYDGHPVYGFRTPSSRKRDSYARFFYLDTFDSAYGDGWKHEAGKVAHSRNGAFCYSFVPTIPPAGYPNRALRPPGNGKRHRVTVMGPGVTPVDAVGGRGSRSVRCPAGRCVQRGVRPARRAGRQILRGRALTVPDRLTPVEFRDVLALRRMHRSFLPDPIPRDVVERVARSVRRAPSGGFSQGQSVVVVTDDATRRARRRRDGRGVLRRQGVAGLHVDRTRAGRGVRERVALSRAVPATRQARRERRGRDGVAGAVLVRRRGRGDDARPARRDRRGLAAAFTGHPEQEPRLRAILGLPDDVVPIGVAFVGRPAPDPKSDTSSSRFSEARRPLADVVHWERWQSPADV